MTSLADDLLRSRTIPELRELVNSLEKDSGSKKTELQHMVGSKYHDFIQSADKITSMKEKSVLIENQIGSFWNCNQQLLTKAQTILTYSQPTSSKFVSNNKLSLNDINCSSLWAKLNECNVFEASKLILLADLLSPSSLDDKQLGMSAHFEAKSLGVVNQFADKLSENVKRQLQSVRFLKDTVVDDIQMLLLCDGDEDGKNGSHGASLEVLHKAKALAALSLLHMHSHVEGSKSANTGPGGAKRLLQEYLAAAEVRVKDILNTQLAVDKKMVARNVDEDDEDAKERLGLGSGITSIVKLLQQIMMDVHMLFLSSVDPTTFPGFIADAKLSNVGLNAPVVGLVGYFQKALLHDLVLQLQSYSSSAASASNVHRTAAAALEFDHTRAYQALVAGAGATATPTSVSNAALMREQRRLFKSWVEGILQQVTVQCKAVLSSLTSAAEVAQLQQTVWAACVSVTDPTAAVTAPSRRASVKDTSAAPSSSSGPSSDASLATVFTYTQRTWDASSAALLASTTSHSADSHVPANAHTYLWCNVFRACFLHQVERLLKHSCDEVLAHTKLHILRMLRQQGVTVDPSTLRITSPGAADSSNSGGKALCDYAADVSQLSSPKIYQLAEKIRLQFEQDISRLMADVVEPVQNTETPNPDGDTTTAASPVGGTTTADSADPQSIGALARAMRTQCAQLVGHTMVLLRNLVEALQRALKDRNVLPVSGPLYENLRGAETDCLLTPDLRDLVKKHCGCSFYSTTTSTDASGTSEGRGFERGDHNLLCSLLFLGRLSWLFKIRGSFLDYALESRGAGSDRSGNTLSGLSASSGDHSASGHALRGVQVDANASFIGAVRVAQPAAGTSKEDQFRSAFEIADTNGDGVLSYSEALEALQALSGESDLQLNNRIESARTPAPSTNAGTPFNLSPQLTPTLTYTEFALICGSTLLSGDDCQPALRLHRCLEQVITTAHVTWAVSVVHVLGRHLRSQYTTELGFASAQIGTKRSAEKTTTKTAATDKKPFKVSWVSKWIDLDGSVDEDGVNAGTGGASKEQVFVPGGMCQALRVFLHKVNQHGSAALVSIDTMQTAPATMPSVAAKRNFHIVGAGPATATGVQSGMQSAASRDEFADLLGEIEEVSEDGGEELDGNAFFDANGLLAALAGCGHSASVVATGSKTPTTSVVLAHVANRLLAQLSLSFIHQISMTVLNDVRPTGNNATPTLVVSNESLEEASLQCVFDLSVCELLAKQWGMAEWQSTTAVASKNTSKRGATEKNSVVGLSTAGARWKSHLDPINAELVLPLVKVSTASHMASMALLAPHCNGNTVSKNSESSPRVSHSTATNAKTSEQLLARVFPSASHTAARFVLLPLAVSTAPPVVATSTRSSANSTPTPGSGSTTQLAAGRASASAATATTDNSAAGASKESTSSKNKGVMNWWG